jgi:hypothetical protein
MAGCGTGSLGGLVFLDVVIPRLDGAIGDSLSAPEARGLPVELEDDKA